MHPYVPVARRRILSGSTVSCARVAFALIFGYAAGVLAACPDAASRVQELTLQPDQPQTVVLAGSAARVLVEEVGVDVEYRWRVDNAGTAIDTPPGRLGFAVLDRAADALTLRIKQGQGAGRVRVTACVDASDALFLGALAQWLQYQRSAGANNAQPLLAALAPLARTPLQRAWFANAYANALLAASRNNAAVTAFHEARASWLAAGRRDRAAIALMAAGEDATRSGRFDDAQALLQQARDELARAGISYYALRSRAALCNLQTRRARYREAVACEESTARLMEKSGEFSEAVMRRTAATNLHLRFDEHAQARAQLDAARPHVNETTDTIRARYDIAQGNYDLTLGDLPAAAQAYARASARLGDKGQSSDQANLDGKLAWLAGMAGARVEHRRLLERAAARLTPQDAPVQLAGLWTDLAEIDLDLGDPGAALLRLAAAKTICDGHDRAICSDSASAVEVQALLDLGRVAQARALLATLPPGTSQQQGHAVPLLAARALIADGQPQLAQQQLAALDANTLDPNQRALRTRLEAAARFARGDDDGAVQLLLDSLAAQARQAAAWPSGALRISARNRLATLQAAIFAALTRDGGETLDGATFARLVDAIDAGSVHTLFRLPASGALPLALRQTLSASIVAAQAPDQRNVFLALAQAATPAAAALAARRERATPALAPGQRVLLPLETEAMFVLIAWSGGDAHVCLRLPLAQYRALAERYDRALDGDDASLDDLAASAREWYDAIRRCPAGSSPAERRWTVVSVPGTRALPWSWIAAAAGENEPTVETVFKFPMDADPPMARPASITLLDLNMPNAAALPYAPREREALQAAFAQRRLAYRTIAGAGADAVRSAMRNAPALHVIGHANPAVYGQLYQGLWFESDGKPTLLTWPEIAATTSRAQVVVLSACGTDIGQQAAFGATSRLAEAFIAAGARRVVAASNALSDAAAPVWTGVLHEEMWKNGDIAEAARKARAVLRASPHFRHPKFWAGIDLYVGAEPPRRTAAVAMSRAVSPAPR